MATELIRDTPTVTVPAEALETLLNAWAGVTAMLGKDEVPPEADDAADLLNALMEQVLS